MAESKGLVMAYFDGNTVGPLELRAAFRVERQLVDLDLRTVDARAINLISGRRTASIARTRSPVRCRPQRYGRRERWLHDDGIPIHRRRLLGRREISLKGRNVGDLLMQRRELGWFAGGFDLGIQQQWVDRV